MRLIPCECCKVDIIGKTMKKKYCDECALFVKRFQSLDHMYKTRGVYGKTYTV
jgi:hypothetical protein